MIWYKKDNSVQIALRQLALADMIVNNASAHELAKEFNIPQTKAINLVSKIDNGGSSIDRLKSSSVLFRNLFQALYFTITEYPLSQADLTNIHTDTKLLVKIFGSLVTNQHIKDMENSKCSLMSVYTISKSN